MRKALTRRELFMEKVSEIAIIDDGVAEISRGLGRFDLPKKGAIGNLIMGILLT